MRRKILAGLVVTIFVVMGASAASATVVLQEWAFNLNGTVWDKQDSTGNGPLNGEFNSDLFDWNTGLGTIRYTSLVLGVGNHYVAAFLDQDIDNLDDGANGYSNEQGFYAGTLAAGQTWEIDEPGWVSGDIFDNLLDSSLDNSKALAAPDDVSMAMGWNFTLAANQYVVINFILNDLAAPASGFYLTQTDPDSSKSVYFSSIIAIRDSGSGTQPIPEPATMLLLSSGLGGLALFRKRGRKK